MCSSDLERERERERERQFLDQNVDGHNYRLKDGWMDGWGKGRVREI